MKIAALRFAPYSLPFAAPFRSAHETLRERRGWLVCVEDSDGTWGIGEAAPLAGFGMESHEAAGKALADWSRGLPGREVVLAPSFNAAPRIGAADLEETGPSPAFGLAASHPGCPAATHALELALLDLAARRQHLPLARLLNPGAAREVSCNALLSADSVEATARNARTLATKGFGTLKLKVTGEDIAEDIERLQAVREAVGGAVKLRIDANGSWTEAGALPLLEALAPLEIEYVEQPLPAEELEGMARLTAASPIAIAADEAVISLEDARRVLGIQAARVLVLKPMALGGVLTALRVARLAARQGTGAVITTMLEGAYGRAGATHAAAALAIPPGAAHLAHGLATGGLLAEDLCRNALEPEGGRLQLRQEAGLGLARPAILA